MKVAMLSWESLGGPAWSSAAVIVSDTARALAAGGHEVHVFTARAPGQAGEAVVDGVHHHRCAHDPDPDPCEEMLNLARSVLSRLRRAEEHGRFSIVHGFEWPAAGMLGELRRAGEHVTVWSFTRPDGGWRPPVWLLEQPSFEPSWSYHPQDFADRILAPSEQLRRSFLEHWGLPSDRVEVLHPGVDPAWPGHPVDPAEVKARLGCDTFDPVVLFAGDLTPAARPGLLIDAMLMVLERHPDAKAFFAGDGELAEFTAERSRVLGIEHAVRLLGEVPDAELAQLCQSCDVVCIPQRSRSLLSPCFRAWAAAKPVVVTPAHAAAAFVWHEVTGYVAEDTAGALAAGLLWMFEDFDRCRWLGANGRRAVEDAFGWAAISARLLDCYRRAAGKGLAAIV